MSQNTNSQVNPKTHTERITLSKVEIIIIILLFLMPALFTFYSISVNEKIDVGIILTNDGLFRDGQIAKDGLNNFHNIFNAKILDIKFNESMVRIKDGDYLNDDYFDTDFAKLVRDKYDVEIILILTDKTINNWLGDGKGVWGQADTKHSMAVVTTFYYQKNESKHEKYIVSTSRHELLHLLGYVHPNNSETCVTQYATLDTELCWKHKLDLPYRSVLWKVGKGHDFFQAIFLIRLAMFLILSTVFVALIKIIQFLFKKYLYKKQKINQVPLIFGIFIVYLNILISSVFIHIIFSFLIWLSSIVFVYIIIEAISYELQVKKQIKKDLKFES